MLTSCLLLCLYFLYIDIKTILIRGKSPLGTRCYFLAATITIVSVEILQIVIIEYARLQSQHSFGNIDVGK